MVERSLRAIGVTDGRVLDAMRAVPRHLFVPESLRDRAYEDTPLPIGEGQTISAPDVVGFMSQALRVKPGDRVLDVGTGSGYQAAVLARMGCRVFSIEIVESLAASAARRLKDLGYDSVTVRAGDGYLGWPEEAPFDGILVAAAPDHVPGPLADQLKPGARLVLPVGPEGGVQSLLVITKREDGTLDEEEVLAVRFVPMTRKRE
jgi:protein-L-isoaspartate(D-aspartate) O-methyltransferase